MSWLSDPLRSLTVAMMSRITLHLRRQVRSHDGSHSLVSHHLRSYVSTSNLRSRLRFVNSSGARSTSTASGEVNVVVEETSVVHDDLGNIIENPDLRGKKDAAIQEWYELRPPAPVHLISPSRNTVVDESSRDVHFVT